MGAIYLNGIRYGGLSGPPEGDQVYVNPIVNQGIKIAEITVNDTTDSLYAPGGVTDVEIDGTSVVSQQGIAEIDLSGKQDALTAGTNITIDTSTNTISATDTTYNVFTTGNNGLVPAPTSADSAKVLQGDGTWVPQTGGTDVEANPQGAATDDLEKILIGSTIYDIAGTGGTTVIANPSDPATESLTTVQIDQTVYSIVGSGGGGGEATIDLLWDSGYRNIGATLNQTYNFPTSITDYDELITVTRYGGDVGGQFDHNCYHVILVSDILNENPQNALITDYDNRHIHMRITSTTFEVRYAANCILCKIYGVKMGGGTTVIANPVGQPTSHLNKIQIDNTIYDMPGSEGKSILAWKNITPTQYNNLSTAEKNNGTIYFVNDSAQGASGFMTQWKNVSSAPSSSDNVLYLQSTNANNAMGVQIVESTTISAVNDNIPYLVKGV